MIKYTPKELLRFYSHFDKTEGCWIWNRGKGKNANTPKGYGNFTIFYKSYGAHVLSYEIHKGEISKGYFIDHLCRNPSCVNPDHLEAVTCKVNTLRGIGFAAKNHKKTHCPAGHEYTPENTLIRKCGRRRCIKCTNIKQYKVYWQKKNNLITNTIKTK